MDTRRQRRAGSDANGRRARPMVGLLIATMGLLGMGPVAPEAGDAREIEVPGTRSILRIWDEPGVDAAAYAISLDGIEFSPIRSTSYHLELRSGRFDPRADGPPPVEPELAAGPDTRLQLVQFVTPPLPAFRTALAALGAEISFYVPNHAYVVTMTDAVRDEVAALPFVRWVGPYHPAHRLEPAVRAQLATSTGAQVYNVMLTEADDAAKRRVADRAQALGGIVRRERAGKYLLELELTRDQLRDIIRSDDVLYVDRWSPLETDMDLARAISGANQIELIEGWTGQGVRGEVIDAGFNLAHQDFQSRPLVLHTPVGENFHGASTSGIIFGDGSADPAARGMLPDGQGIVASTEAMVGQARYDLTAELVQSPYEAVFQSASVGSARTTAYTTISADMDAMLFDFDLLLCQSQSNAGNQESRPQAWAKNIVSIGGVRHEGTLDRADDNWGFGASIGPAEDGRIKPDLCHFYDNIFTVTTGSPTEYTGSFGGTSGATPIVAGHFGLFFQMWSSGIFNNDADPLASVFENRPHMTTAKALMINTAAAYDWTQGGPNADIDRFKQGWGMPDLVRLHALARRMYIVDEADLLTVLDRTVHEIVVDPGEPALRVTMTWADPPGTPGATASRVNDLSVRVESPSGTVYWGNHGLRDGRWSLPGGAPDSFDTVENVFIENPEPGLWEVEVIAFEINQDGHPETQEAFDVSYALVASGVRETLPPLILRVEGTVPALVPAGESLPVAVEITPGAESIVAGSETLHYRFQPGDPFATALLTAQGDGLWLGAVPGATCGSLPEFFVSAEGDAGTVVAMPPTAPEAVFRYDVGVITAGFTDDFESDAGWTVVNETLADGAWERGVPAGDGSRGDPTVDFDGSGRCFVTGNAPGNSDVDGGPTRLTSPSLSLAGLPDPELVYARWFSNDDEDIDRLTVEVTADGVEWVTLEAIAHAPTWIESSFRVFDVLPGARTIQLRFSVADDPNDSITEAAVDAVRVRSFVCEDEMPCVGDVDADGLVDFGDLVAVLASWGPCPGCAEDLDDDGVVGFFELVTVLSMWGACP